MLTQFLPGMLRGIRGVQAVLQRGAGTEEPVNLWRKADGAYAGPACEKGTDHPVFKPARLCGFRVLPEVW